MRAYLALSLLVYCTLVAAIQLSLRSTIPAMGPVSVEFDPSLTRAVPLPYPLGVPLLTDADVERAVRGFYWVFLRARPQVAALWVSALLAGVVGMGLHVHALRRLETGGAAPTDQANTAPPPGATVPPTVDAAETAAAPASRRPA